MKFFSFASSIVLVSCLLLMAGCESLGIRDYTATDQVPPEVKARPLLVEAPKQSVDDQITPRLGDVPFKPKDFSPKPIYDHYMNELEYHRDEAVADKKQAVQDDPVLADPGLANPLMPADRLVPPQLPSLRPSPLSP